MALNWIKSILVDKQTQILLTFLTLIILPILKKKTDSYFTQSEWPTKNIHLSNYILGDHNYYEIIRWPI